MSLEERDKQKQKCDLRPEKTRNRNQIKNNGMSRFKEKLEAKRSAIGDGMCDSYVNLLRRHWRLLDMVIRQII